MVEPAPQQPPERPSPDKGKHEPGIQPAREPGNNPAPEPMTRHEEPAPRREGVVSDPDHR